MADNDCDDHRATGPDPRSDCACTAIDRMGSTTAKGRPLGRKHASDTVEHAGGVDLAFKAYRLTGEQMRAIVNVSRPLEEIDP